MPSEKAAGSSAKKKTTKKGTTKRKTAKRAANAGATRLRVRQVRSGIGYSQRVRRTLVALGLKHHQDSVVLPDNRSIRGMLQKVHHLVSVTPEEA